MVHGFKTITKHALSINNKLHLQQLIFRGKPPKIDHSSAKGNADPNCGTRPVELMGNAEEIAKGEQLINDAEAGGSVIVSRRLTGDAGSEHFEMKIPNNKVGLVIGKGGETIKNMQARTGARIQVIPLYLPPGDPSTERTLHIDGTSEQIKNARELVDEVISENRMRNPGMAGGYQQQGYQARPPASWGQGDPPMQQPGYGYMQSGGYPDPSPQYNMSQPPYGGYPSQPSSGGYGSGGWDQSAMPPSTHSSSAGGYDYYYQQPSSQQQQAPGGSAAPADGSGYHYSQPGQGYAQDGYGGFHAPPQSGYGQPSSYEQQGYVSAWSYDTTPNPSQEGQTPSYGGQGDSGQAPTSQPSAMGQQGYNISQMPSPNPGSYPPQGSTQAGYGVPPTFQAGYGSQPPALWTTTGAETSGYWLIILPMDRHSSCLPPRKNHPAYGQAQQLPPTQEAMASQDIIRSHHHQVNRNQAHNAPNHLLMALHRLSQDMLPHPLEHHITPLMVAVTRSLQHILLKAMELGALMELMRQHQLLKLVYHFLRLWGD
ncbi:glutenin, high molecular weight subunit DX5-like [Hibiscus syriacus]|uniref:glutenin, high molecular weight subunit DX5-like n=1 Tax=Hibiscus syriacus TaxID=106335 RepID=UPI001924D380|nr:glutenin, high molecular weight subunit DX5-like [Hibiscus syriacus]